MTTLTIYPDFECKVFIDTEFHGIASANSEYEITLEQGVYWVECRSTEQPSLYYDFDYKATSSQEQTRIEVILRPEIRLQELKAKYDFVGEFQYGFAEVRHEGELVGYVDENYTFCYDEITLLCDNVLRVCSIGKYGVINFSKEVIVPIKYDEIELLGNAVLRLKLNNRYGLSNCQGTKITALKYLDIIDVKNNTFALYFDKWTFVNTSGVEVAHPSNVILFTESCYSFNWQQQLFGIPCKYIKGIKGTRIGIGISESSIINIERIGFRDVNSIIIPNSVTLIGDEAFRGCSNLTHITIPDSVTSIGKEAFRGCENLESVTIPDSITSIGKGAFRGCKGLKNITISNNITKISDAAFCRCSNLAHITIPNGVTHIGFMAFYECEKPESINIPDSVTSIGKYAFNCCCNLKSINANSVNYVYMGAFDNCNSLESINDKVVEAGYNSFDSCCNLKEFKGKFVSDDGRCVIIDGELKAFAPAGITSYIIPNGVISIGGNAFRGCENLESVTIPDSVTSIGEGAFASCKNLKKIILSNKVESIGKMAF